MVLIKDATNVSSIQLQESAAPSNPASGFGRIYLGTDGKLRIINDTPATTILGGGALGVAQDAPTELTIASGAITLTQGMHRIDTEGNAASDDLDTINGGVTNALYLLRPENAARTVILKSGAGNIRTINGNQMTLSGINDGVLLWYDGSTYNVINSMNNPNDLGAWSSYPDSDLHFAAQDSSGNFYKVRGDEMQYYQTVAVTSDGGSNPSASMMAFFFDSTTEDCTRNITGTVIDGHSMAVKVKNIFGAGSGHKIVLPSGCYWNDDATNRAIVLNSTSDWFFAVARSATNYEVMFSNGITYAAS